VAAALMGGKHIARGMLLFENVPLARAMAHCATKRGRTRSSRDTVELTDRDQTSVISHLVPSPGAIQDGGRRAGLLAGAGSGGSRREGNASSMFPAGTTAGPSAPGTMSTVAS
jgi:hypothetical protein